MVDAETRAGSLFAKISRTDGLLGVFRVLTDKGFAYRTAPYHGNGYRTASYSVGKSRLFREAENADNVYLVGVYNNRIPFHHLLDDVLYAEKDRARK